MTGRLIRCSVKTPERPWEGGCTCPIRWTGHEWVHDPELETDVWSSRTGDEVTIVTTTAQIKAKHREHIDRCLHTPRPPGDMLARDLWTPEDLELAQRGRWIKRRKPKGSPPDPSYAVVVFKGQSVPGVVLGPFKRLDKAQAAAERYLGMVVPVLPASAATRDKVTEVMA